jgi:endonuclease/exonuclease/phosphatase (EEP) superfamily protein YafD
MTVALVAITAAWLAFVVLHRLLSGRFWLWLLPDLVPPVSYLAAPVLLLAVSGLTAQPWCAGGALAALVIGAGHSGLNRNALSRVDDPPPDAFRVVSWNTQYWDQDEPAAFLHEFLTARDADVYVLQEYLYGCHLDPQPVTNLATLHATFPDHHVAVAGELSTLSRFPIAATPAVGPAAELPADAPWRNEFYAAKVLRTDLHIGATVLSVYNVHLPTQYSGADNPLSRGFYARLRDRDAKRKAQLHGLRADIAANPNPVLVTGDFNSTAAMGDLRWLRTRLSSANRAARHVFPSSWPAGGPALWQLDWTFTRGLRVHGYRLLDPRGISDHRTQELLVSLSEDGSP